MTTDDVLSCFDSFGDNVVQGMALQLRLKDTFSEDETEIVTAINKAIEDGLLLRDGQTGVIRKAG